MSAAAVLGYAPVEVGWRYFNRMFIDVVAMHRVQLPVVKKINVVTVADCGMTAIASVDVAMLWIGETRHDPPPSLA